MRNVDFCTEDMSTRCATVLLDRLLFDILVFGGLCCLFTPVAGPLLALWTGARGCPVGLGLGWGGAHTLADECRARASSQSPVTKACLHP